MKQHADYEVMKSVSIHETIGFQPNTVRLSLKWAKQLDELVNPHNSTNTARYVIDLFIWTNIVSKLKYLI